jgi:hypothetical protein
MKGKDVRKLEGRNMGVGGYNKIERHIIYVQFF